MSIEDAFRHDILAHPDDDAPRLIFADWLEEQNDPRGEFIRVQCALAQLSDEAPPRWPLEQREQELLREHEASWMPKNLGNVSCVFRRGFVEEIALSPEEFHHHADHLFERWPIRRLQLHRRGWVSLSRPDPFLAGVASSRHLPRIRKLSLIDLIVSRQELRELLGSPLLGRLTELQLSRNSVETNELREIHRAALPVEIVHDLTEFPFRSILRTLYLDDARLSLDALRVLATTPSLTSLTSLNLNNNRLTHEAVAILAGGRLLPQLETLSLDSNLLGDAATLTMRDWPLLPRLTRLSLGHNQIFAAGVQALAAAPALSELISLDLFNNISCDTGVASLASSHLSRLRSLNLRFNGVGDMGVRTLARSETFSRLTRLNLTANRVTNAGARALIESPMLSCLARLDLPRNNISASVQKKLRRRFGPYVTC